MINNNYNPLCKKHKSNANFAIFIIIYFTDAPYCIYCYIAYIDIYYYKQFILQIKIY